LGLSFLSSGEPEVTCPAASPASADTTEPREEKSEGAFHRLLIFCSSSKSRKLRC
jgi:hypothetical protein